MSSKLIGFILFLGLYLLQKIFEFSTITDFCPFSCSQIVVFGLAQVTNISLNGDETNISTLLYSLYWSIG